MLRAIELTLVGAVVLAVFWVAFTCPKCGRFVFFGHKAVHKPTPSERTMLRVFSNGRMVIGPISLHELAAMAQYGSFDKDASILYFGCNVGESGFDMSLEWRKLE
jgi:hypothetical protein